MDRKIVWGIIAGAILILFFPRVKTNAETGETTISTIGGGIMTAILSTARGYRNNNPGNIRRQAGVTWQGQADEQTDASFVQFISAEYGIRAMNRVLDSYARRGIDTVRGIISTWAPSIENDTVSYVNAVASDMGVSVNHVVTSATRPALIKAIIRHENGSMLYTDATINAGISLA